MQKKIILGSAGAVGLALIIAALFLLTADSPAEKFSKAISTNEYADAIKIYDEKIKGNTEKEAQANTIVMEAITAIQKDFTDNKTDFASANIKLETLSKTGVSADQVKKAASDIKALNDSRIALKTGQELIKSGSLKEGLAALRKVIGTDPDYAKSQELIKTTAAEYKAKVLGDADKLAADQKFPEALASLEQLNDVTPNDPDVVAKKTVYTKQNADKMAADRKIKAEQAKANQEITVEKASILVQDTKYKSLYPDMISVITRNNTTKTVKSMKIGSLAYDSNGLPIKLKMQYSFGDTDYEFLGTASDVNMLPGGTYGNNRGWSLDDPHGISTVLSLVKEVEYYDGSKWINPYYEFWIEQYKNKPLVQQS